MLSTILGWFTSGIFSSLFSELGTLWTSYMAAKTDAEKAAIMERIHSLQAQRDLQIAEASQRINGIIRALFAAPFVIYIWKLVVWDKIVMAGAGTTDDLSNNLWYVAMTIVGFYFLHWTVGAFTGSRIYPTSAPQ
jgi:hypothetical protein